MHPFLRFPGALALSFLACAAAFGAEAPSAEGAAPEFVGSETCAGCHAEAAEAWRGSHHGLAWTTADGPVLLGDFDDATFTHDGVTSRFFRRDGVPTIETDGPDGAMTEYPVAGVAGIAPLQQYLLETEPGRLQSFDVVWDAERERWYHLYPDQDLPAGDGLHWTGPYKTWNARCAECHATGYEKRYDPRARRYDSRQAEIGVGCEACHGPGSAHVAWAGGGAEEAPGLGPSGLVLAFDGEAEAEIQQCAGCHSRREPFMDGNPPVGTPFHDAYRLALLRPGLYHADGTIQDEVYVYGSFLQSRMYAEGVRCTDCHEAHSAALKAEGDAVCTQCHSPAGNPRFPTLTPARYDDPAHHFHPPESEGARCVSCHMVERVYMGIDWRRDHAFRVPRPDLAGRTGAPDACTDCHADRDPAWAAAEIAARFPETERTAGHFSITLAAGRRDPASAAPLLVELATYAEMPGIVRATALEMLGGSGDAAAAAAVAALLEDPDPLVREAAVRAQRAAPPTERVPRIVPLLSDPARTVRLAAVRGLLDAPVARFPPRIEAARRAAAAEWRATLMARADYPETHLVLGGTALTTRNVEAALAAFGEAVRLDPQLVDAWSMIVRINAAIGEMEAARAALDAALAANPGEPRLEALR